MLEPTNKKVISHIIASQQNEVESECLQHFKKYVRSLDTAMLKHLLCFLYWSRNFSCRGHQRDL